MALKLTVVSDQRAPLGTRGSIVFGVGGGSIGRAHDNDWVLPDPERYLSAHHARVRFRDGTFVLFDTSTNGVYVNERNEALGRRAIYALRDGDRLRLGEYQIAVSIDAEAANAPEASSIFPLRPGGTEDHESTRHDIGADLKVQDLLRRDPSASGSGIGPVDAFGQPVATQDPGLLAFDQSERRPAVRLGASGRMRAAQRAAENDGSIESFCRGVGIDPRQLGDESHARVLHLAGMLLREALVGLKGLALAQREVRDQNQIEVGREDPQQIGLTGLPVEDLLLRLLQGHAAHRLDAVQWLRDTLASTRRHDVAVGRALRAALVEFVARLDPKALRPQGAQRSAADADVAALRERFLTITEMTDGRLPHLFVEAFARVFAAEFRSSGAS